MAFTGKTGKLSLVQILGLIKSTEEESFLHLKTESTSWCLQVKSGKIIAIGGDAVEVDIEDILITRGLLKAEILKNLDDDRIREKGLAGTLAAEGHISQDQADQAVFHFTETAFFEFLGETQGEFEWRDTPGLTVHRMDPAFGKWIYDTAPDLQKLNKFRTYFSDFDARLFWITPAKNPRLPAELDLKEIYLLSRYRPNITVRTYWKAITEDIGKYSELLVRLSERGILTPHPPGSGKIPNAKPFLRALLARVVDQLQASVKLLGSQGEIAEILRSINENLVKIPDLAAAAALRSEDLGNLSTLTGSLDGLLDLNGVEELNLQQDIESGGSEPAQPSPAKPAGRRISAKPAGSQAKSGVKRQPAQKAGTAESAAAIDSNESQEILRKMQPDPKREAEALQIIESSRKNDRDGAALEEKVEAKVRYRRFMSEVTMAYNRFSMTRQTLFEMFGVTPNSDRKAIHKSFLKRINTINPKGIVFSRLDHETLEKAIFLRDQYKKAYITLMDDTKKRAYIDSLRTERQEAEDNKVKAMQLFNQGMDKVRAGKFDEARELFRRAAKFDPNSPVYYSVLEDIDKEEREGNAVKFFQAGILAFKQKNDYDRAIKLIRKAISLRPLDPTYHLKLAEIQALSGEHKQEAVDSYLAALDLDPGNQELRLLIANFLKNLGRKQEAANMYRDILKWNPEHTVVEKHLQELLKEGIKPVKDADRAKEKAVEKEQALNEEFE
ncbi:MAG TPA: tetratricopeptide repeat protein [bacterium]|nr:tetratricopeptide repeat protein [bacterium]